jgi:hypothetical protein
MEGRDPPWVIVVDTDEWLDVWKSDVVTEDARGSVILTTEGFAAFNTSRRLDLADIDLHTIRHGTATTDATVPGVPGVHYLLTGMPKVCALNGHGGGLTSITYDFGAHVASIAVR